LAPIDAGILMSFLLFTPWVVTAILLLANVNTAVAAGIIVTVYSILLIESRINIAGSLRRLSIEALDRKKRSIPNTISPQVERWEVSADNSGLTFKSPQNQFNLIWQSMTSIETLPLGLFISGWLSSGKVLLLIPSRILNTDGGTEFIRYVQEHAKVTDRTVGHKRLYWRMRWFLWFMAIYICWSAAPGFSLWLAQSLSSLILILRHLGV